MTREEAIDELSVIYERLSHTEDCANGVYSFADGDYLEAIDMAIEALSEPSKVDFRTDKSANISTKVKSDIISRVDAIDAVRMSEHRITIADEQGGVGTVKWDMWGVYTAEAVEAIKALPSADAEPKWTCTANFVAEQLNKLEDMSVSEKVKLIQDLLGVEFKEENLNYEHATLVDIKEPLKVAVVRCKDCKYSFYDKDYEKYNCRKHEYVECFDADDYCSWGERND